ncbi:F-box/LRR-repeat protein [Trifolium pratense]|uniref:F-box/LRR-repeat protein n=1 Tax=Trifolium pratense TaxID=57577 RepID=A0A2K3LP59_TRIPR|nr:F-box/LRR-repeat protein [Trifolium pratense]
MWRISDSNEESIILEKIKRRRQCDNQNEENDENEVSEDRLSDLPDSVLLHILSFLNTKHVVRTCILSTRWKHLWKRTPAVTLYTSRFSISKQFPIFVSKILTLRDTSTALHALDLDCGGVIEPPLLKKILNYICSHNTNLQELGISVTGDTDLVMSCVFSCRALTSLKLSLYPRGCYNSTPTLFPKSLNMPALTNLDLTNFTFCGGENGCAQPFLAFSRLNSLVIRSCTVKDGQTLNISSETLVNLAMHNNSPEFDKIELSAPSLCTFTFIGSPYQQICGDGLSSVKQVNIDARHFLTWEKLPMVLLSWLQDLANVKLLTVSSITLQVCWHVLRL